MTTTTPAAAGQRSGWTPRRVWTDVILTVATIVAILAIVAIWANRQLLNADNWAQTSTTLLENPAIRTATANYLVDQLYKEVNVQDKIESVLPPRLDPLAGPLSGALRSAAVSGAELALTRPVVQNAWREINRAADQALITIVNGGNRHVTINNGEVTLNLGTILNDVAQRLGINVDIGAKLPPAAANLVILRSNQLKSVQDIGGALKGLAVVLTILLAVLYVAAMVIAKGRRRRTLMAIGVSAVVAGLVVLLFRSIIVSTVPGAVVKDASLIPVASATVSIATTMLTAIAGATVLIGVIVMIAAWFAGPARLATAARRPLAPIFRKEPAAVFAVVAALLLLLFIWQPIPSTAKPLGMVVYAVLAFAGTEALRRQMKQEFPVSSAALAGGVDDGGGGGASPPDEDTTESDTEVQAPISP